VDSLGNSKSVFCGASQGCQIFLGTTYQNRENIPKQPQNIPNGHKIYAIAVKYVDQVDIEFTNIFFIARQSKISPNWDFWFENIPSGNPGASHEFGQIFIRILTSLIQKLSTGRH
jgi:hypothetical protein